MRRVHKYRSSSLLTPSSPTPAAMLLKTFACVLALAAPALAAPIPIRRSAVEAAMLDIKRDIMPTSENLIAREDTPPNGQSHEDTVAAVVAAFPEIQTNDEAERRSAPIAKRGLVTVVTTAHGAAVTYYEQIPSGFAKRQATETGRPEIQSL